MERSHGKNLTVVVDRVVVIFSIICFVFNMFNKNNNKRMNENCHNMYDWFSSKTRPAINYFICIIQIVLLCLRIQPWFCVVVT